MDKSKKLYILKDGKFVSYTKSNNNSRIRKKTAKHKEPLSKRRLSAINGSVNPSAKKLAKVYSHLFNLSEKEQLEIEVDVKQTALLFNHLIKHRGLVQGTKRFKDIRNYVLKLLLGIDVEPVPCLSTKKDGFPKDILFLKKYNTHPKYIQIVYTILSISRLTNSIDFKIDSSSIRLQPNRDENFINEVKSFGKDLPMILKKLNIKTNRDVVKCISEKLIFHDTCKSGPNSSFDGLDALTSSHYDAYAITQDTSVSYNLKRYLENIERTDLYDYIEALASKVDHKERDKFICSKLVALKQPENKQRVVAIIDYFSQCALLPLHKELCRITKFVPNTYVFDQDKGRDLVKSFTNDPDALPQSSDASNWTDRFPMELQEQLLIVLFNKDYARKTRHLLTNRDFKISGNGKSSRVRYGAGQPMGAYPSFSLANLTHSLYVYWKCIINDEDPVADTAVCGDDICFRTNSKAYNDYVEGIQYLGIQFNPTKGFNCTSKSTRVAEFCKYLYLNGTSLTPLSPRVAALAVNDFKFAGLLNNWLSEDNNFVSWLKKYESKYVDRALGLHRLPPWITGINSRIDISIEEDCRIFGFKTGTSAVDIYNVINNVTIDEFNNFIRSKNEIRFKSYSDSLMNLNNLTSDPDDISLKDVLPLINDNSYSRLYTKKIFDINGISRVLAEAKIFKLETDAFNSIVLHPLMAVIIDLQADDPDPYLVRFMDEPSLDGLMSVNELEDLTEVSDSEIAEELLPLRELITAKSPYQDSLQILQRKDFAKAKQYANEAFVVGSKVIDRIRNYNQLISEGNNPDRI